MKFNLEDCLAFVTCTCGKMLSDKLEKRLKSYNVTRTQWIALYYLTKEGTMQQNELADKLVIKEPSVVRLLDKMELFGWITRDSSEYDKRIKLVTLTDKGMKFCKDTESVVNAFKGDAIRNITEEELEVFKNVVNKMKTNMAQ